MSACDPVSCVLTLADPGVAAVCRMGALRRDVGKTGESVMRFSGNLEHVWASLAPMGGSCSRSSAWYG